MSATTWSSSAAGPPASIPGLARARRCRGRAGRGQVQRSAHDRREWLGPGGEKIVIGPGSAPVMPAGIDAAIMSDQIVRRRV